MLKNLNIGLGVTGSFCNFDKIENLVELLKSEGVKEIIPIVSYSVINETNRFSNPKDIINKLENVTGNAVIDTISKAEPIGPNDLIDVMLITPCTGNTLAKLAQGITDTPVLMATKSHLRNNKPVVIGLASNDALGINLENLGKLFNTKNINFIPLTQDDYNKKPKSLVYDHKRTIETVELALKGIQIQPIIYQEN